MSDTIDHRQLLAEIDDEVRRRRESGDLPADFERELDLVFARFAPVHAIGDDFAQVLERAEQSTFVDVLAPTASTRPLVSHVKRVIRKAIGWEMRYVAQQVSAFAGAITRAVRLLGRRVDTLEQASPAAAALGPGAGPVLDVDHWADTVLEVLAGTSGRVLHAECGDGALVARLAGAGLDAYGVDPVERAVAAGLEVRTDEALDHLRALPDAALGGLVLSGCVDRLPVGAQFELASLAAAKVAPGGAVVVVSADPRGWGRERPPVEVDLAGGRPLHRETWCHLLGARHLDARVLGERPADPARLLRPVPGADPALAANLERLNELLFPPTAYAVAARRG
ncbi:MAG: hypothetical protein M3Q48_01125 [Actinomycetota bacterium]|nr:hypothetical protein [Actinomycetota bacterium]